MMNSKYTCNYEGKLQSNLTADLNCQRHISLATIVTDVDVKKMNIVSAQATESDLYKDPELSPKLSFILISSHTEH